MFRGNPRRFLHLIGALLTSGVIAAPAIADDWNACAKESGDAALAACTRAIRSGTYTGRVLALAYSNRGVEWKARGDVARAWCLFGRAALDARQSRLRVVGEAALLAKLSVVDDREAELRLLSNDVGDHLGNDRRECHRISRELVARAKCVELFRPWKRSDVRGEDHFPSTENASTTLPAMPPSTV
jgi:hypothetical protein